MPVVTPVFAKVSTKSTLPVPSKETAGAEASPEALKSRPVSSAVAVSALPVKSPTNPPVEVVTPITDNWSIDALPETSKPPLASIFPVNVETPVTLKVSEIFTASNSLKPSTSKLPLASILPVNVDTPTTFKVPDTLTSSSSTNPSTSRSPLASIFPVNVETPVTLKVSEIFTASSSVNPSTSRLPFRSASPVTVKPAPTVAVVAWS